MNFAVFKESDGLVIAGVPYPCTEPYGNNVGAPVMVDVYVDDKTLKVFTNDVGIQFFFHMTNETFKKAFGE